MQKTVHSTYAQITDGKVCMNDKVEVRRKLEYELGVKLPDYVWEDADLQDMVRGYLNAVDDSARQGEWEAMTDAATKRMQIVKAARAEALQGVSKGLGATLEKAPTYSSGRKGEQIEAAPGYSIGLKSDAMLRAMSEFFAGLAHRHPEVVTFREEILGRLLTQDEAHALLASPAARMFPPEWFSEWEIPIIEHRASIVASDANSSAYAFDHRVTVHLDPPGITKKVRYADRRLLTLEEQQEYRTHCMSQSGGTIPPINYMPIEWHGEHGYPPWLWPGSVVGKLFDLSDELVTTFDWPAGGIGQLAANVGAWFVLTGEAPNVRPIDARWEQKSGNHLNPQWRIRLIAPTWLPEEEVSRAYRLIQKRFFAGRIRLPDPKTLEVARFVWEQERQNGYNRLPWPELFERWNKEYPGFTFKSYNNFRTVCMRGMKAVTDLNFSWPEPAYAADERLETDTTATQYVATQGKPEKTKRLRHG